MRGRDFPHTINLDDMIQALEDGIVGRIAGETAEFSREAGGAAPRDCIIHPDLIGPAWNQWEDPWLNMMGRHWVGICALDFSLPPRVHNWQWERREISPTFSWEQDGRRRELPVMNRGWLERHSSSRFRITASIDPERQGTDLRMDSLFSVRMEGEKRWTAMVPANRRMEGIIPALWDGNVYDGRIISWIAYGEPPCPAPPPGGPPERARLDRKWKIDAGQQRRMAALEEPFWIDPGVDDGAAELDHILKALRGYDLDVPWELECAAWAYREESDTLHWGERKINHSKTRFDAPKKATPIMNRRWMERNAGGSFLLRFRQNEDWLVQGLVLPMLVDVGVPGRWRTAWTEMIPANPRVMAAVMCLSQLGMMVGAVDLLAASYP